jgi:hypothetical protein
MRLIGASHAEGMDRPIDILPALKSGDSYS